MAVMKRKTTIAATTTTTNVKMMLYYTVLIACISCQFLSVNAIRCHQCNSHLEENCLGLHSNIPKATFDAQFLKECEGNHPGEAFCRKTDIKIDVTGDHRVIRGCGWIKEKAQGGGYTCFTSDNEGFKQIICTCNADGCNGGQTLSISKWSVLAVTAISVALATVFRRN